ncbi:ParA family protein [Xanthomonas graminis]|uniref:Cobyrinic acid a,c-diamide synthase n=1 Tax=Xanthomonas graminis pv. arrhenatheri LMG 727 TaxID=1195923 RepID=A0A0K2ZXC8_9XANT|nr:AAA family ATPase [Xanthomonas translucens]UKE77312.1 AAA family ATPase [Xanthomonas translucens pv. arrhenatheri]CTP90328.1 cobyrinic acid a,c-diamide synthase [Xanthomonas translucens pv. arrhenatheri LMG 727]
MRIVTLYNHKGGVSKTTSTFNLASYLAESSKRVLMVDADPQCNLTEIALAPIIRALDEKAVTLANSKIEELPGTSILDALNQRIRGDVPFIDLDKVKTIEVQKNLHLLRGSVDLSSIEDDLAEAHVQRTSMRTNLMRTYVAIGDFLVRLAEKEKYDYIFIDVGPSSGALTRAFFLQCDAFFLPVAPDRFNVQAIGTLSRIIDRWMAEHQQVISHYKGLGLPIRPGTPAFLGAIVQSFKLYKGVAKPGYKLWMNRLPKEISSSLKAAMQRYETSNNSLYLPSSSRTIAVEISDFNQLAPLMQEAGRAVFSLDRQDTAMISESGRPWSGNNWTDAEQRMKKFRALFGKLATILENYG